MKQSYTNGSGLYGNGFTVLGVVHIPDDEGLEGPDRWIKADNGKAVLVRQNCMDYIKDKIYDSFGKRLENRSNGKSSYELIIKDSNGGAKSLGHLSPDFDLAGWEQFTYMEKYVKGVIERTVDLKEFSENDHGEGEYIMLLGLPGTYRELITEPKSL